MVAGLLGAAVTGLVTLLASLGSFELDRSRHMLGLTFRPAIYTMEGECGVCLRGFLRAERA